MAVLYLLCLFYFAVFNLPSFYAIPFKCNSNTTCNALVDYFLPNTTTISAVQTLFNVPDLYSLLGVNSLPLSTNSNKTLLANTTFTIPFPCLCTNGTGISNHVPVYTVVAGDGLFHIASDVFSGLVKFPETQAVNNITDPNRIFVGQKLWIPLPCSCDDDGGGRKVVHYGLKVGNGNTVAGIAELYNTSQDTLLSLNGLATPKDLIAGAILDVPLPACVSPVSQNSLDYPLLVTNGSYAVTAGDCVKCSCDASNNWTLTCKASELESSIWESCPNTDCKTTGTGSLSLGNITTQGCNRTTCTYSGYNNQTIFSSQPILDNICPAEAPGKKSSSLVNTQSWKLNAALFISVLLLLL